MSLQIQTITAELIWELTASFFVSVFIIALWEEIVNRGYIQTRLQTARGFWGVIVATLLFAAMHVPSALLDYENDLMKVAIQFIEAGLGGLVYGFVYWCTRSVLTTIAIHGLNNFFVTGLLPLLTGISAQQVIFKQSAFQLVWLIGQVGVAVLFARIFFNRVCI
jgi:membrane protease YdiL (CAAX protease family)